MTNQQWTPELGFVPTPPTSGGVPAPKPKRFSAWTVAAAIAGLIVGIFLGGAALSGSPNAADVPTPTPSAQPAPEVVYETVTETVTPQACFTALQDAELIMGLAREGLGLSADSFNAVGDLDPDRIDANNAKMDELTPQLSAAVDAYNASSNECRTANQ